jgi:hypothetical protein
MARGIRQAGTPSAITSSPGHAQRLQRDRLQRETGFKRTDKIISFNGLNPKSKFLVFIHSNS